MTIFVGKELMAKLNISLAQMNIALGEEKRNYNAMLKIAEEAARRGSHLLVLPELWTTGYALERRGELSSAINSGMFTQISTVATQNKVSIVGSMLEKRGNEVANSSAFFASNGRMLGIYRKIHLFEAPGIEERKFLQKGSSPLNIDLPWGKTGIAICYDLRFPELFRRYAVEGATMIIISAEWPLERIEHWRALLIARAIENQCYIVACNSAGETGGTVFGGHSMIVDPWGRIIIEGGEDPNLLTVEAEIDMVGEVREAIPVFRDRRPEIYEALKI
jgi:omega-amidase